MTIKEVIELLLQYKDADENYYKYPVLRRDLEISHNEILDNLLSSLSNRSDEEVNEALGFINEQLEQLKAQETRFSTAIDDYKEREDLRTKFEADLLKVRAKMSALNEYKTVIETGRIKGRV